ncbi:MAG: sulfotransferase [Pseudomonadota bacterium]
MGIEESAAAKLRSYIAAAEKNLGEKRYEAMHVACMEAVKLDARHPRPYFLLGLLGAEHGRFDKALELFDRSISFGGGAEAHAMRARCLVAFSRPDDARTALEKAATLASENAHTLDTIGVGFARVGDHDRAISFFRRAVALDESQPGYLYNLGSAEQFVGDLNGAEETFNKLLTIEPSNVRALSALVQMTKQRRDQNHLPALTKGFEEIDADKAPETALQIGHAIAKTYEDFGEHAKSLEWLNRAKDSKRRIVGYHFEKDAALFQAAKDYAPPEAPGFKTDEPIFIIGMPRTGTTLVDRILSSHPKVTSAGELSQFSIAAKRLAGTGSPYVLDVETLRAARSFDFRTLGEAYLQATRPLSGKTAHFTDKMPLNFFYAGLIHAALPNAKIVCVLRDPLDTCFSNYRQLFSTAFTYYVYNLDLTETAKYVAAFNGLMDHWREALPAERFHTVRYERIIEDQEVETRRLLGFCGLEWDEACLNFHQNAAPVATASASQVRKPLYSSSIGQWRRYGAAAEGLRAHLPALRES